MFKLKAPDGRNNLCGQRLMELRKKRGLSQRGFAKQLQLLGYDMDYPVIRRIESGERYVTDIELVAFCKAFGIEVAELLPKK